MDAIDILIDQKEKELFNRLTSISDPQIRQLAADLTSLKRTQEILKSASLARNGSNAVFIEKLPSLTPITQGDAAIEIIRRAGRPLHVNDILREMPSLGITTIKQNLVSVLLKDRKQRFERAAPNTFKVKESGNGHAAAHLQPMLPATTLPVKKAKKSRRSRLPDDFSLVGSIKALLPELKGEFSQRTIYDLLCERNLEAAPFIQRASIATMLRQMAERDKTIEVTYQGHGSDPRRYKVKGG